MITAVYILAVVLAFLQLADVVTTKKILDLGGYEKNPFVAKVIAKTGIAGLAVLKAVFCGFIALVCTMAEQNPTLVAVVFFVLTAFYANLIHSNMKVIKDLKVGT